MNDTAPHPHPLDAAIREERAIVERARRSLEASLRTSGNLAAILDAVAAKAPPAGADPVEYAKAADALRVRRDQLARFATPITQPSAGLDRIRALPALDVAQMRAMADVAAANVKATHEVAEHVLAFRSREFQKWNALTSTSGAPPELADLVGESIEFLAMLQRAARCSE